MAFLLYFTALVLSGIAAYYSVIGLIAIFSAAALPVAIMGSSLEVAKLVVASWLYRYWNHIPVLMKTYFTLSLVILMLITSMGIFGFLSKAHNDQNLVSGDVLAKIAIYDEKIKIERDNIDVARRALNQMDAQVNARLERGTSEESAERAIQIRRQQANERVKLQKEIAEAQKKISSLNEERAPIAAEVRKVEAEVGPIKYIAALIYGDNTDVNTLEQAVIWLIIILIFVFDPLAVLMLIAANLTQIKQQQLKSDNNSSPSVVEPIEKISQQDKEIINDDAYKIIPDQVVMPMVVETAATSEPQSNHPTVVTPSIDSTASVEKVGIKKYAKKVAKPKANLLKSTKQQIVKKAIKKPVAKKVLSKKKIKNNKVNIVDEPVIIKIEETVQPTISQVQELANEDKSVNEGFIPQPAAIQDQVQQMIETNDQQGLEQVYKQIVKELTKKNRSKSTHWGPIKNTKNG